MKKNLILFIMAGMLSFAGKAQDRPATKQECTRRCNDVDRNKFDGNPQEAKYNRMIEQIQAQKKLEADPAKLKALQEEEASLIEQRLDHRASMCRTICNHLPEE